MQQYRRIRIHKIRNKDFQNENKSTQFCLHSELLLHDQHNHHYQVLRQDMQYNL